VLGAGRWRGTPATVWRNVTPTFIYRALRQEALPLENGGKGSRDFVYVEDICRGLLLCALRGRPGEVYNLASGVETSIRELAETINRIVGNPTACELLPRRPWDNSIRRFGSTAKARGELGFSAQVDLKDGLRQTIDWTRRNLPRIEAAIGKHRAHVARYVGPNNGRTVTGLQDRTEDMPCPAAPAHRKGAVPFSLTRKSGQSPPDEGVPPVGESLADVA
jgi:UDP-glucose 4-epimerase